ncbi:MAG: exosortase/archaeosortase family protein [Planctomycetota bacterium]|jgi:exosortase
MALDVGRRDVLASGLLLALLPVALLWSYWPTIDRLIHDWRTDDNYSVGALVPLAAAYLLWHKRAALSKCRVATCWSGAGLILAAQVARAFGLLFYFKSAERYSLVFTVCGLVLLVAGRRVFRQVAWLLLFLFLMVPLPGRIHNLLSNPLQNMATASAVFTLELLGVTVIREGNVMVLNHDVAVAVAEACSGLRMLTAFVIVAVTLAFVVNRPRWQKATLVLSSIPVAILCNLARLVATAFLYLVASSDVAERFFHDFAGLTMMPLAVLILVGELWIMARLVIEDPAR